MYALTKCIEGRTYVYDYSELESNPLINKESLKRVADIHFYECVAKIDR